MAVTTCEWLKELDMYIFAKFPASQHTTFERLMQIVPAIGIGIISAFLGSIWEHGEEIRLVTISILNFFIISFIFSIIPTVIRIGYVIDYNVQHKLGKQLSKISEYTKYLWFLLLIVSFFIWFISLNGYIVKLRDLAKEGSVQKISFGFLDNVECLLLTACG